MVIKKEFQQLTNKELWEIAILRTNVFTIEQRIEESELDIEDYEATHYFIKIENIIVSYARVVFVNGIPKLGRVCTNQSFRNKGLQTKIIKEIINEYDYFELSAQNQTINFYKKHGLKAVGEKYLEANIIHQKMIYNKELKQ